MFQSLFFDVGLRGQEGMLIAIKASFDVLAQRRHSCMASSPSHA